MILNKKSAFWLFFLFIIVSTFSNVLKPVNTYFLTPEVFVRMFSCLFMLVAVVLAGRKLKSHALEVKYIDIAIIFYFAYKIISLLIINKKPLDTGLLQTELCIFLLYFMLRQFFTNQGNDVQSRFPFVCVVFVLSGISILTGILEYFDIIHIFNASFEMNGGFTNPGPYGNYLTTLFPFFVAIALSNEPELKKLKSYAIGLIVTNCVVLAILNTRTAWISCIVSTLFLVEKNQQIRAYLLKIVSTSLRKIGLITLVIIFTISISWLLYNLKKDSSEGRLFIWKSCLTLINEKPILGHGLNSFKNVYNENQINYFKNNQGDRSNAWLADEASYAFNDYLEMAVELGLIGFFSFLTIIFFVFKRKTTPTDNSGITLVEACQACILSSLSSSLFSYPLSIAQNTILLFLFAAYIASFHKSAITIKIDSIRYLAYTGVIAFTIAIGYAGYKQMHDIFYRLEWKNAFLLSENNRQQEAFVIYNRVYPHLKNDWFFLFNYGTSLPLIQRYDESITVLEKTKDICIEYNIYINLGASYEAINEYSKAEECFYNASLLIPSRFVPKYKLFKLYWKTNNESKALSMAEIIRNMAIKVDVPIVRNIKMEAILYINNNQKTQ